MLPEIERRAALVQEAREYVGTKYHRGGMVKGAGVDCATLLFCVLRSQGIIQDEQMGVFDGDWWNHTTEEVYIKRMLRHAYKVAEVVCEYSLEARPGDLVLFRVAGGRIFNHGCIVTQWPNAIHASGDAGCVVETDMSRDPLTAMMAAIIFDPFRKGESV